MRSICPLLIVFTVACASKQTSDAPTPAAQAGAASEEAPAPKATMSDEAPTAEADAEDGADLSAEFDPLVLEITSSNVGIFDFSWPATVPETEGRFDAYPALLPEGGTPVDDNNNPLGEILEVSYDSKPYVTLVAFADGDTITDVIEIRETKRAPYEKNPVSYESSETKLRPSMTYGELQALGPVTCSTNTVPIYAQIPTCWLTEDPGFALSFRRGKEVAENTKAMAFLVLSPHVKGIFSAITP